MALFKKGKWFRKKKDSSGSAASGTQSAGQGTTAQPSTAAQGEAVTPTRTEGIPTSFIANTLHDVDNSGFVDNPDAVNEKMNQIQQGARTNAQFDRDPRIVAPHYTRTFSGAESHGTNIPYASARQRKAEYEAQRDRLYKPVTPVIPDSTVNARMTDAAWEQEFDSRQYSKKTNKKVAEMVHTSPTLAPNPIYTRIQQMNVGDKFSVGEGPGNEYTVIGRDSDGTTVVRDGNGAEVRFRPTAQDVITGYTPASPAAAQRGAAPASTTSASTPARGTTPVPEPAQPAAPASDPMAVYDQRIAEAQREYQAAMAQHSMNNVMNLRDLRDLMNRYTPPETPEERYKREKKEYTRRNIAAALSMAGAIGNLATATGTGQDGRSVAAPDLVTAADKGTSLMDARRKAQNDAWKATRDNYMNARNAMAQQNLTATMANLKLAQQQKAAEQEYDINKRKAALDAMKAQNAQGLAERKLLLEQAKMGDQMAIARMNAGMKQAALKLKEREVTIKEQNGGKPGGKGGSQQYVYWDADGITYRIPKSAASDKTTMNILVDAIPDDFFNSYTGGQSKIEATPDTINQCLASYLRNAAHHKKDAASWNVMKQLLQTLQDSYGTVDGSDDDDMPDWNDVGDESEDNDEDIINGYFGDSGSTETGGVSPYWDAYTKDK